MAILCVSLLGCSCWASNAFSKPNLLLIVVDDLGYADLSSTGVSSDVHAPNIDHHGYHEYRTWKVIPGKAVRFEFPKGFSAHWVRLVASGDCVVSAVFTYE